MQYNEMEAMARIPPSLGNGCSGSSCGHSLQLVWLRHPEQLREIHYEQKGKTAPQYHEHCRGY